MKVVYEKTLHQLIFEARDFAKTIGRTIKHIELSPFEMDELRTHASAYQWFPLVGPGQSLLCTYLGVKIVEEPVQKSCQQLGNTGSLGTTPTVPYTLYK